MLTDQLPGVIASISKRPTDWVQEIFGQWYRFRMGSTKCSNASQQLITSSTSEVWSITRQVETNCITICSSNSFFSIQFKHLSLTAPQPYRECISSVDGELKRRNTNYESLSRASFLQRVQAQRFDACKWPCGFRSIENTAADSYAQSIDSLNWAAVSGWRVTFQLGERNGPPNQLTMPSIKRHQNKQLIKRTTNRLNQHFCCSFNSIFQCVEIVISFSKVFDADNMGEKIWL